MNSLILITLADAFFPLLKAAIAFTVPLSLVSFALGLILALLTALARLSPYRLLRSAAGFYVWIVRGTPLLVQLFIIFYGLPAAGIVLGAWTAAVIGFTLSVGAYCSEILRSAILAVPQGQWEAASALGLSRSQTLYRIILPQAARVAVPPLANSFISLIKETSLAATITLPEMFQVAQRITAATYEPLWLYSEAAFIYLMLSSILSKVQGRLEVLFGRYNVQ